ncbi:MAG: hypothetical protein KatS3mg002_0341 [Candidatus Woesearchaeota archaeon]|nr:MAG: hypothetical protein KatS3mg002_0341 [Candidatus Woesearchaeota archaeon]
MTLKDAFNKLKVTVLGTKTTEIDSKLDKVISDISSLKTNSDSLGYVNLIKSILNKSGTENIFSNVGASETNLATFGQGSRLSRYKTYESIVANINYCYRALNVLTDNILSPDDITKISLDVKNMSKTLDDSDESLISYVKEVISIIKLEKNIRSIIYNTLLKGDFFCEITTDKDAIKNRSLISENLYLTELNDTEDNKIPLRSIKYILHNPEYVLKLQTESFPICLGYLVFPRIRFQVMSGSGVMDISQKTVDEICLRILRQIQTSLNDADFLSKDAYNDLKDIVSQLLLNQTQLNTAIRFVPPDRMQHFFIDTMKYFPYGESIFDSMVFTAKVLIALETALTIQRLNRSTEKRKIAVEMGLTRDAKKVIEQLREEFKKRKISIDSFGTIDTIPSMITTFEDIYIPQKDGKAFVDIQTLNEGNVDVRSKVDELKFMRDQLVASIGIPPAFIGIEENCLSLDTRIPLLSGETISLGELIERFENGEQDLYTYSFDHEQKKIVPGKIIGAKVTRKNAEVLKVHLDNGESVICTPDHKFLLRDGETYVEAKDLKEGMSLMPLYRRNYSSYKTSRNSCYEEIYQPIQETWELTHHCVAKEFNLNVNDGYQIHHLDKNPRNNHPNNLISVTKDEHIKLHSNDGVKVRQQYGSLVEERTCVICCKKFIEKVIINKITCSHNCMKEYRKITGKLSWYKRKKEFKNIKTRCGFCGKEINLFKKIYVDKLYSCKENEKCTKFVRVFNRLNKLNKLISKIDIKTCSVCGNLFINRYFNPDKNYCNKMKCVNTIMGRKAAKIKKEKSNTKLTCTTCGNEFIYPYWQAKKIKNPKCEEHRRLNHKVIKVEKLNYRIDTGDITIEKHHNFALASGIIVHNSVVKATLSEENLLFARTVIGFQKTFSEQLTDFIHKIIKFNDPEKALQISDIRVVLPTPKGLQMEREVNVLNNITSLIENLERLGIPKEYSIKKYLHGIDWEEVDRYKMEEDIEKKVSPKEDEMGGGGFGGGGF